MCLCPCHELGEIGHIVSLRICSPGLWDCGDARCNWVRVILPVKRDKHYMISYIVMAIAVSPGNMRVSDIFNEINEGCMVQILVPCIHHFLSFVCRDFCSVFCQ